MGPMKATKDLSIGVGGVSKSVKAGEPLPDFTTVQQISALNAQGDIEPKSTKKKGE